jgi:predicted metal-dependent phosphotriesterase family hydrolase
VAISTGHLSADEAVALGREARKMDLKKFVFGHPDSRIVGGQREHIKEIAEMGFFVEFTFLGMLPAFQRISPKEMCTRIKEIGANRSILTTDAFFEWSPPPSEMMRMFIGTLLEQGITGDEIETMVRRNPEELLNVK